MKKNKLILFDWGGIVEDNHEWYGEYQKIFHECGYDGELELSKYRMSAIPNKEEFRKVYDNQIKKDYNLNVDFEVFIEKFIKGLDPTPYYKEVVEYEHSLKDKCYIGILSNLAIFDKDRLERQVGLSNYDYVFLSFEFASKKPEKEIFEMVQERLPFDKQDILFIDDRKDNIEVAKEFGWNTCNATGLELDKIKEACESFIDK